MKILVALTLASLACHLANGQATTQTDTKSSLGRAAAYSRGIADAAELLWRDPSTLANLHCAAVVESAIDFDTGLAPKIIDDGTQQVARRTKFKLQHQDSADSGTNVDESVVDWITSSRGLRNLPRPAKAAIEFEAFTSGNMLLFTLDPRKEGRVRYTVVAVLPQSFLPALTSARDWRQSNAKLFAPAQSLAKEDLKLLRAGLKSANVLVRLCTLLRLAELNLATFEDAVSITSASNDAHESSALTLVLLKQLPAWTKDLASLAIKLPSDSPTMEGIALGAAINFLGQDDALIKSALKYQTFRDPTRDLPPDLASSLSYPILSAIGDKVKPLNQSLTIDPNTALARLLVSTRSLHQLSVAK